MRRAVLRVACSVLVAAATVGGLAACRSQAPMLQPVAPVPTLTSDGAGG